MHRNFYFRNMSDEIDQLSNDELREKLCQLGENIGPITDPTRSMFKKKLLALTTGSDVVKRNINTIDATDATDSSNHPVDDTSVVIDSISDKPPTYFAVSVPKSLNSTGEFPIMKKHCSKT